MVGLATSPITEIFMSFSAFVLSISGPSRYAGNRMVSNKSCMRLSLSNS
jgi:hypothetical protein